MERASKQCIISIPKILAASLVTPQWLVLLVIYFFLSCYAAGTYISCGIVVPMLLIGGLYGRMIGRFLVDQFGIQTDKYWAWMDPGAFALLGSV